MATFGVGISNKFAALEDDAPKSKSQKRTEPVANKQPQPQVTVPPVQGSDAPIPISRDDRGADHFRINHRNNNDHFARGRGRGRGGRGGSNTFTRGREFDRISGTGRGREVSKDGHGKYAWGSDHDITDLVMRTHMRKSGRPDAFGPNSSFHRREETRRHRHHSSNQEHGDFSNTQPFDPTSLGIANTQPIDASSSPAAAVATGDAQVAVSEEPKMLGLDDYLNNLKIADDDRNMQLREVDQSGKWKSTVVLSKVKSKTGASGPVISNAAQTSTSSANQSADEEDEDDQETEQSQANNQSSRNQRKKKQVLHIDQFVGQTGGRGFRSDRGRRGQNRRTRVNIADERAFPKLGAQ